MRPQDFMDAEDGLFNNELERKEEYDTFGSKEHKILTASATTFSTGSIIPGALCYLKISFSSANE